MVYFKKFTLIYKKKNSKCFIFLLDSTFKDVLIHQLLKHTFSNIGQTSNKQQFPSFQLNFLKNKPLAPNCPLKKQVGILITPATYSSKNYPCPSYRRDQKI